jgi:hypothetical protein
MDSVERWTFVGGAFFQTQRKTPPSRILPGGVPPKLEIAMPQRLSVGTGAIKVQRERPALEIVGHPVLSLKSPAPNNLAVSALLWRWGRFLCTG